MQQNSKNLKQAKNPFFDIFLEKNKSNISSVEPTINEKISPYFNQKHNNDSNREFYKKIKK